METLLDVLAYAAESSAAGTAKSVQIYKSKDQYYKISYQLLYERSSKMASVYKEKGMKKGSYVVFQIDDMASYLYSFWACEMLGAIPVPLPVNKRKNELAESYIKIKNVRKILKDSFLLCESFNRELFSDDECINVDECLAQINSYNMCERMDISKEDVAFIQFSSGSTSTPKGVVLTHENVIENMKQISERLPLNEVYCCANWMPLTHDMGFIAFHLMPLKHCTESILYSTELFLRNPLDFLKCVSDSKTEFIGLSNTMMEMILRIMKARQPEKLDLSPLKYILNGSEPINCKTADMFLDVFSSYGLSGKSMCYCYGMAEASLVISVMDKDDKMSIDVKEDDYYQEIITENSNSNMRIPLLGKPLLDLDVIILNENNEIQDDNKVGEICIRGKNVMNGYLNANKDGVFTKDGFFRTGDKGFLHNGSIAVIGRIKDIIFKNGVNYFSHDLERIVCGLYPEMANKCAIVQINDKDRRSKLYLFYGGEKISEEQQKNINSAMVRKVGFMLEQFEKKEEFPRTMGGKIQRFKIAAQYESKCREEV